MNQRQLKDMKLNIFHRAHHELQKPTDDLKAERGISTNPLQDHLKFISEIFKKDRHSKF
jgi:hypothetical protein